MAYRENVTNLANRLGVSNDPSLREEDIKVAALHFTLSDGGEVQVEGTDMNRAGRLFFQGAATQDGSHKSCLLCDDALKARAAEFFAERWEPIPQKRKLLDALRDARSVIIVWK